MVIKPVISQTKSNQPALPTFRVISALTMKIPDPIMDPATIMVPSSKPSDGLKWVVVLVVSAIGLKITEKWQYNASPTHQNHLDFLYSVFNPSTSSLVIL